MTATRVDVVVSASRSRTYSAAWWGMASLIITEGTAFTVLLAAYLFLAAGAPAWPPVGVEAPDLALAVPFSVLLWASSAPVLLAEHLLRHGRTWAAARAVAATTVMGAVFLGYTLHDLTSLSFGWRDHAYGSAYYVIIGLHALHVAIGVLMSLVVQAKARLGRYSAGRHTSAQVFFLYWHFVDAVWVAVFAVLVVGPHL